MLKRHVLAAHLDDVPPKQPVVSTASSNKKKSSPLSSPADGEEDQKEVPWAESTREKREVGSDGSSWQNNTNDLSELPRNLSWGEVGDGCRSVPRNYRRN